MNIVEIKCNLLHSSSYLIDNYLVDCGDGELVLRTIEELNVKLKGVLLTHCHLDHVCGLPMIIEQFPNIKIFCSKTTYEGLKDEDLNLQYIMPEYAFNFQYDDNIVLLDEGIYSLENDINIEVIPTKGHSNDCLSYIIEGNIFTGDSYIPNSKVFTKWPTSVKKMALESEQKILKLVSDRNLIIRPGHWI